MDTNLEDKIIALETKIAYQDASIEDLSSQLFEQQKVIERLESQMKTLGKKIRDVWTGDQTGAPADQKPPHY